MVLYPPESTGNDSVTRPNGPGCSLQYSRSKPLPIFGSQRHAQRSLHGAALFRRRPAGLVMTEVGAASGNPARVDDDLALDDPEAVQLALGLHLATPNARPLGLRVRRGSPPVASRPRSPRSA